MRGTDTITNKAGTIDSLDVEARIEWLEEEDDLPELREELRTLRSLRDEVRPRCARWHDGVTLTRYSRFTDYLARDAYGKAHFGGEPYMFPL